MWRKGNQFYCAFAHALGIKIAGAPAVVDLHIAAFDPAQLPQALHKGLDAKPVLRIFDAHQHADPPHPLGLLRACRERPRRRRAADERDELAPPYVGHGLLLALWRRPIRSVYKCSERRLSGRYVASRW